MSDPAEPTPANPAAQELDDVMESIRGVGENLQGDRELDPSDPAGENADGAEGKKTIAE